MPSRTPCAQCGAPAERCLQCGAALCERRLCAELHEASCQAVRRLPASPLLGLEPVYPGKASLRAHRAETQRTRLNLARELIQGIAGHRADGRAALLADDLDRAFVELWAARALEADLATLGPAVGALLPADWEISTDLVPLARALCSRGHPRASDAWRSVLEEGAPRAIQAEAAEWLAREAYGRGERRMALRVLHAGSRLGRKVEAEAFRESYRQAGLDPTPQFALYLAAMRLEPHAARAADLRDPLTGWPWADQDPRWWRDGLDPPGAWVLEARPTAVEPDPQREALARASDLVASSRDRGWLALAEGDYAAGPTGARTLGRSLRTGCADSVDHDRFMRVRLAYENAADHIPDVAWPWYRLAELLAWAGLAERAQVHLAQAERRTLGSRASDRAHRPALRALVQAALGNAPAGVPAGPRPFPAVPHGPHLMWRLRLLPGA